MDLLWSFKKSRNGVSTEGWEVKTLENSEQGGRVEESEERKDTVKQ